MNIDQQPGNIQDAAKRKQAWRDAISPVFHAYIDDDVEVSPNVQMKNYNLQRCLFGFLTAPQQRIERSTQQISQQGVDHLLLRIYLSGKASLRRNGSEIDVEAGRFTVFDLSQTMVSDATEVSSINLLIPRRSFERRLGDLSPQHGTSFRFDANPITRLMSDHLRSLSHCIETATADQQDSLSIATIALANAVFTDPTRDSPYERETILGISIRQFIEADLYSFDLGTEKLTARFGISRTALYGLFEQDGGIATYIRDRRLSRAMRILAGLEGGPKRLISTIGYECGFETEKMFSRAFTRKYGINPSMVDATYRTQARYEHGATLMSWIKEL
ncbi:helix-turn-helix domain-containing protein [Methylobacterium sp. WCS2018Hpa-22]|uniref:helix-turn-helix domain-containing protein n=1 Tax=Methylobacterium sp. WCS2018Hpa-22 TaxID=3073633 RepID=UPI00288B9DA5|nr:helix-turn-helix domain-containing protein [Methylobacterium sp. WCS2018Hpa-22]